MHEWILQVDPLCCARGKSDSESARRVKTEILVQMSAVHASAAHVLLLAATNCPHALDEAVRRRFNQVCLVYKTILALGSNVCTTGFLPCILVASQRLPQVPLPVTICAKMTTSPAAHCKPAGAMSASGPWQPINDLSRIHHCICHQRLNIAHPLYQQLNIARPL